MGRILIFRLFQITAVLFGVALPLSISPASAKDICSEAEAPTPIINIIPTTDPIKYDFSKTEEELTSVGTDTESPYGLNVDTTTRGLRHDRPEIKYEIQYGILTDNENQKSCMMYRQVDVKIHLRPAIYVAKEFSKGECGKMILGHEKKHVTTDRWVINKYSKELGLAIQHRVNSISVVGPFSTQHIEHVQKSMLDKIQNELDPILDKMMEEMEIRQGHVDTLEEYNRVNQYCEDIEKSVYEKKPRK